MNVAIAASGPEQGRVSAGQLTGNQVLCRDLRYQGFALSLSAIQMYNQKYGKDLMNVIHYQCSG